VVPVPVPVLVPVLVPVVLLAPLVCDSANRAENTSLPMYGSVQKYTSDTNERTTNEIPFNRKDKKEKEGKIGKNHTQ